MACRHAWVLLFVSLGALVAGGCSSTRVHFDDDFDPAFDLDLFEGEELHLPYATGTSVVIDVHAVDDDVDTTGWTFQTSDPGVLRIDSTAGGRSVALTALSEGTSTLSLRDADGDVVRRAELRVATPDRAELHARGPLRHGLSALAKSEQPRVVTGGIATFEVRYFAGEERVFGRSMLVALGGDAAMEVSTAETSWAARAEWLQVRPYETGTHTLELSAGTAPLGTVDVTSVETDVIEAVELHGREGTHDRGDTLTVLATAFDAESRPIWGVPFVWTLDGEPVPGEGDILTYDYDPSSESELVLEVNGATEHTTIHAGERASVSSSASVGCSATKTNASAWPIPVALALVILGTAFRRRRQSPRASRSVA